MQNSINQDYGDNDNDGQLEKMDQDNESSSPSIHELLSLLVEKTDSIEATLSALLASQSRHDEVLKSVSQTLGISMSIPSKMAQSNNNITKRQIARNRTRSLAATTSRTITSATPSIQNKSQTESSISAKFSNKKHHQLQQQEIPSKFLTCPRPRRKVNVIEAIHSIAKSPTEGEKMMNFLNDNVNRVVQKVYRKAASNQPDLGGKWIDQDENVRNEAIKWLIQTAANHTPTIPLTKCQDDWIIRYFFPRRYNDFIYQEKKRIQKERQGRQRELQQLKKNNQYYASSDMTESSESESSQKSDDSDDNNNYCSASEKSDGSSSDDMSSISSTWNDNSISFKNDLLTIPNSTSMSTLGRSSSSIALSNSSSFDFDLMKCEVFALAR